MIAEERLRGIISAADPNDRDDVAIRMLLAAALKDSPIDFSEFSAERMTAVPRLCEARAAKRAASRVSRRRRQAFDHRSVNHRGR
jgi:hypothetical protein